MKYAVVAAAIAATASAITTVGDGVPLIYAAKPYANPPYDGVQYNATAIAGVPFNASNEWPCLTAEKYFSIPPPCAKECLVGTFKNATICDDDDFTCHCESAGSAELDKYIIPCLVSGVGSCSGEEIGELANFVHAALCPYFNGVSHKEAYGSCDGSWAPSSAAPKPTTSSKAADYWPKTTSSSSTKKGGDYWPTTSSSSSSTWAKPSDPCVTSTQTKWTKECEGPTTFWVGTKTWTVTTSTTLTVTDCPIVWTKPVSSGTWAPVEWTTAAAAVASPTWVYSTASTTAAAGWAKGTAAYSASPAQFTGAASNNKIAGAVAAVAAGAALLI